MSNVPAVIDAEFREVVRAVDEERLLAVVGKWMERSHGIDNEAIHALINRDESLDRYAFTKLAKRAIAAAALELIGELELARKVAK